MALPDGIVTCNVTFGKSWTFTGDGISVKVTFRPDRALVWSATGDRLEPMTICVAADENVVGQVALPVVDQDGFVDGANPSIAVTGWYYTAIISPTGVGQTYTKRFQVLTGQSTVDLDLIGGGSVTPAVTAPQALVTSVNGHSGAVQLTDGVTSEQIAADVANPETAVSDAVSQLAVSTIPTVPSLPYEFFIDTDTTAVRPVWAGPVTWVTTVDAKPLNAVNGDSYRVVTAEAPPWAPSDIPGLMGWYEPSDLVDGATVTSWSDRSQYGRTLTAAGTPVADAVGLNGTPAVTLDGVSGFASASFTQQDNNGPITVFVNAQFGALSVAGTKQLLFNGQNAANPTLSVIRGDHPSTSSAKNRWGYGRASTSVYAAAQSGDQLVHRFVLVTDLANTKLSVDDTDYSLGTAGSAQITQFQVGQQSPATNAMIGKIGTVFWMIGVPDEDTLANAVAYLNIRAARS